MSRPGRILFLATGLLWPAAMPAQPAGDPLAAEREHRVARRLAAERSPQAAAAWARVYELDPRGPLADDALVEKVLLEPAASWPEESGTRDPLAVRRMLGDLDRVVDGFPGADRATEARYLRGLVYLEPGPGYAPARARADLIAVATQDDPRWASRARYTLAHLHEVDAAFERARAGYERVMVDYPATPAATRSRVGRARLDLRRRECGPAARDLQAALEAWDEAGALVAAARERAVRCVLRRAGRAPAGAAIERTTTDLRGVDFMHPMPDGGILFVTRRDDRVVALSRHGIVRDGWSLPGLEIVTVDASGRAFAAAGEFVHRLDPRGATARAAALGEFSAPSALVADDAGGFWVADRRGQRVGRIEPGDAAPTRVWEDERTRLASMIRSGSQLLGLDVRNRRLASLAPGSTRTLPVGELPRPTSLVSGPDGDWALLDTRLEQILLFEPDGTLRRTVTWIELGVRRPVAIGLGFDGLLHVFDSAAGQWVRSS